jgi:FkbM family methyltransferase
VDRNLQRFCAIAHDALGPGGVRTIVEVGARDCGETLDFHATFPQARIYTFECNPATLPKCRAAVLGKSAITLIECAVSNASGPVTFYSIDPEHTKTDAEDGNPGGSSLLQASGKYELETYVQKPVTVEAITLSDAFRKQGIQTADLLWMDIQGAELMALEGAGDRLKDVKLIHTEVEFVEIYAGQPLFPEIKGWLEARGFVFLGFTTYSRHFGDAVFANPRWVPAGTRLSVVRRNPLLLWKRLTWLRHRVKRSILGK